MHISVVGIWKYYLKVTNLAHAAIQWFDVLTDFLMDNAVRSCAFSCSRNTSLLLTV
jgi:hypothetical protein